jgi:hypothetical protein
VRYVFTVLSEESLPVEETSRAADEAEGSVGQEDDPVQETHDTRDDESLKDNPS